MRTLALNVGCSTVEAGQKSRNVRVCQYVLAFWPALAADGDCPQ